MIALAAVSPASANSKYAALVIHADTGDILFDRYSTQKRYPASLTKMMTLYMLFRELEAGNVDLDTPLKVSSTAASMPASKLGVTAGSTITVEEAIHALIIKSANDVAVVVAEKIGDSESRFARMMTEQAHTMGMHATTFRNASGLPNSTQVSTARDLAILSQRIVQDFPQYYHFFGETSFTWKGKTINGHNKLVDTFDGADGLKTGYTRLSGYNLATTARRGDDRLIGIVLGGRSSYTRDAHMKKILDDAYQAIEATPTLISALHREKPEPNLKPTTLAKLGGVWPKPASGPDRPVVMAAAEMDTVSGSPALQAQLKEKIESGDWKDADALTAAGDLAALSDADKLNTAALRVASSDEEDITIGEGDIDYASLSRERRWSIQTGAYRDASLASTEMVNTKTVIAGVADILINEISETTSAGKPIYRIRFNGMTENEAQTACKAVIADGGDCFTLVNPAMSGI
ncbi:D-alanyl-D-alanine carboxypeptidase family protein [Aquisalinus flavus]|uniref:Penicillin-binding protein n=1 Tax=Aquisalinus flavus TaxID=1526572 RepID=A0A8J2Y3H4_9PROT|nr:D-alanyl-D-alanine carboxypeptidase family protein [Aquisalinus flavus]MBD0427894.1 D-alanyl-D-alanine carboxypeptidase [Aquisalinus flavus]GGD04707.1 penicillin-binding protein [Aquisalinus flavus]